MSNNYLTILKEFTEQFEDIEEVEDYTLLSINSESEVFLVNDSLIVKRAKTKDFNDKILRERTFLLSFQGVMRGLAIPYPKYFAITPKSNYGAIAYRKIEGVQITKAIFNTMNEDQTENLSRSLASFLQFLHNQQFDLNTHGGEIFPPNSSRVKHMVDIIYSYYEDELQGDNGKYFDRFVSDFNNFMNKHPYEPVLIHGDFWFGNHIIDKSTKQLQGIIDFSSTTMGNRFVDITVLSYISPGFRDKVYNHYLKLNPQINEIDIKEYSHYILGLREIITLYHEIRRDDFDPDTFDKFKVHVLGHS